MTNSGWAGFLPLCLAHFMQGCELDRAMAAGRRALARATALSDVGLRIVAQHNLGHVYHSAGNYRRAVESFQNVVVTLHNQALALADEFGMRPLVAHCHLGLGTFYRQMGRGEEALAALSTAIELYRAMDMTFWLTQAEAALAQGG